MPLWSLSVWPSKILTLLISVSLGNGASAACAARDVCQATSATEPSRAVAGSSFMA
jgi:hypothetical protein